MFTPWTLFLVVLGYLILLFVIAYYAERKEKSGRSIVSNPYVYSLSLAVYCTSWTFYGSVGKAATSGLSFLTIYLGPTLMASLWWVVLRKIIRIAKENRITTISDFIGSRYGKSLFLSALVTIVAVVGIGPYLGLQIKAIISTFTILAGETKGSIAAGWFITLMLGIFAIIFGARRLDSSERHEGLVFAIAFESIVKLIAFLFVGFFVTYGLFDGFFDIFERIKDSEHGDLLFLGGGTSVSYNEWASLLFLSMMAIMFLPRQFHVAVVENSDVSHVSKAMWLFPLYLFLINIFVMPVAHGGLLLGGSQAEADSFVLTIPLSQGKSLLALFVFIGGFSAATAMIIVESLAISTMVMNNLVMPAIYRFNEMKGFPTIILNLKRIIIMGSVFLGYFFAVSIGEFYTLVDMGLKSFEAVTLFAPAFLIGLYWKQGSKKGVAAGLIAGFVIWLYTLLMPALLRSGLIEEQGILAYLVSSEIFNPHALFGLKGLDKWSHSLLWSLFFNLMLYFGVSIFTRQTEEEERQALVFVESYSPRAIPGKGLYSVNQVENILLQYIGRREAREAVENFLSKRKIKRDEISHRDLLKLRDEAERILSGALGAPIATLILEDKLILTKEERGELSSSIKVMSDSLRLSRQELAEANRELSFLKEFSQNIIESVPLGIATLDAELNVRYWNKEMEIITGISKGNAHGKPAKELLSCMEPDIFAGRRFDQECTCQMKHPSQATLKVAMSPFRDPGGGYVLVFEDITEKKRMEEQLLQASKHASIGKLTAGVSHEIGNPLASISSLVQELQAEDTAPFVKESLKTINQHIERIARIVRSLGDFARLYRREKIPSNIKDVLDSTTNLTRYDKKFNKIDIETDIEEVPLMKINPDQLQQVFLNLMLNALDAMPDGGKLRISIKRIDGSVEIIFKDTGIGVDKEIIDRVFDPFFTTKGPGKGTGLGLSICYGIIKDHGGTINVDSEKGHGTTFIIRLPLEN